MAERPRAALAPAAALLDEAGGDLGGRPAAKDPEVLPALPPGGGWQLAAAVKAASEGMTAHRLGQAVEVAPPLADAAGGAVLCLRSGAPEAL